MTKNSVCCTSYLRNHTSYDCHLWYTYVKWWYLQLFFSFFSKLWFFMLGGSKGKKWPKMTKNYVCHIPYIRKHTSYDCDFWYTCKMMKSPDASFQFCKILIFQVVMVVKWQKKAQNYKKLCLSHSVSQELYLIWLWFFGTLV